jgi:hypothetical protein
MRRLCLCFSFLLAALVVAPNASAQGGLNLNQTYRDVIRLHFPAGKTQIPLPEGNWELLGLQEDQSDQVNRIWRAYLARIENGTLLGKVIFSVNSDAPSYGWAASSFCEKDDHYHVVIKVNRDGDVDCWAVRRGRTRRKSSWSDGLKQMYDTLEARGVDLPYRMPIAVYIRRNDYNTLKLIYWFNPATSSIVTREDVKEWIVNREDVKEWAAHWKSKVDAGFLGELEAFKAKKAPVPLK